MRIVISGYYGFSNLGDDAILEASIPLIRASHPDAQITVVTYPGSDLDSVYRATGLPAVDGADIPHVDQLIAAADLVLIGGGGLIQDHLSSDLTALLQNRHNNLTFWTSLAVMAYAHEVPASTWFVGIGPLSTQAGRDAAGVLLSMMQTVSVRDEASAALAAHLGVPDSRIALGGDPVFGWSPVIHPPKQPPTVGVVVRNWGGISAWIGPIANALDDVVQSTDAQVRFLPFQVGGTSLEADDLVAMRIRSRMAPSEYPTTTPTSPSAMFNSISECDVVLGMRLHSVIAAAAASVPVVALSYDPKVRQTMERLGRSDFVTDLAGPDAEWISERLKTALLAGPSPNEVVDTIRTDIENVAAAVLQSQAAPPAVPPRLVIEILITSLREVSRTQSEIDANLDEAERAIEHRDRYIDTRVAEISMIRSEFQSFRDARAVKLAEIAWTGSRWASEALDAVRSRTRGRAASTADTLTVADVVASAPGGKGFVVFAPSINWDVDLFQRPQQMAVEFARRGYTVMYQVGDIYRNGLNGYRRVMDGIFEGYLSASDVGELAAVPAPIVMAYVYNFEWIQHLESAVTVYEHIDDLSVFEHSYTRDDLHRRHRDALRSADIVVGSARDLVAEVAERRPDALLVPNGVDVGHFAPAPRPVPPDITDLVDTDRPILGYFGALAEWFDYELVRSLALSGQTFVLVGPDYDGSLARSGITDVENVRWLGPKPYGELPAYLDQFTIATIPFVLSDVTHSVSPLKLFEYMAGGKPVITTPMRECSRYPEVLLADGVDEWLEVIEIGVRRSKDPHFQKRSVRAADANSWRIRVDTILGRIESIT